MISGVYPAVHGILGYRRPQSEGGEYYWSEAIRTVQDYERYAQAGVKE